MMRRRHWRLLAAGDVAGGEPVAAVAAASKLPVGLPLPLEFAASEAFLAASADAEESIAAAGENDCSGRASAALLPVSIEAHPRHLRVPVETAFRR